MLRNIVETAAAAGAVFGTGFYVFSILCAWRFLRGTQHDLRRAGAGQSSASVGFHPPVSILKPVRGADAHAYECFRSHCRLDYPEYEIIFGVHDPADPAIALVERLKKEFPERRIKLLVCSQELGPNRKVSNLIQMLPAARYDHLLVNDGDIRVPPDYLQRIMPSLAAPKVGLVTALYRPVPGRTLVSKLEALSITDFASSVLVRYQNGGAFPFAFGATLAFPRRVLEQVGGFEALADYLADDSRLASMIVQRGYSVVVSNLVVDTTLPDYSLRDFWQHQLRWARTVRDASPRGYSGLVLVFGVQWAVALIAAAGAGWSWALFALAYASRIAGLLVTALGVCKDQGVLRNLWLLPLRDLQAFATWIAAHSGRTVTWHGDRFLLKHGRLLRIQATGVPPKHGGTDLKNSNLL